MKEHSCIVMGGAASSPSLRVHIFLVDRPFGLHIMELNISIRIEAVSGISSDQDNVSRYVER